MLTVLKIIAKLLVLETLNFLKAVVVVCDLLLMCPSIFFLFN